MFFYKIDIRRFVQIRDQRDRLINKRDRLRQRIAYQAADARGHIDARATEFVKRKHFEPFHAARFRPPNRFDAEQI